MQDYNLCRRLFESSHVSRTVLRFLWTACGIFSLLLWTQIPAKAAFPQIEGRVEVRPRPDVFERRRNDLGFVSPSGRRQIANRLKLIDPEKDSLKRWLLETPCCKPDSSSFELPKEYKLEPSPFRFPKEYKFGSSGDQAADRRRPEYVRWIQESLNRAMGMNLEVDGKLSPDVEDGIREFQRSNGLDPDGIVGPKTESKLSEVTNTNAPVEWPSLSEPSPFAHATLWDWLEDKKFTTEEAGGQFERKTVFLDVRKRLGGGISVTARTDGDWWLKEVGLPELGKGTKQDISSADELEKMLGDANTVVHRGDDLPEAWRNRLRERRDYLRNSLYSPKEELREYVRAAELLENRAEPGKTRVFSALPQSRDDEALSRELKQMGLDTDELEAWQWLQGGIDELGAASKIGIEAVTKKAFLEELREGTTDTIVLIAHSEDGIVYLPDGETITSSELSAIQRETAPDRNLILITCEAGQVNTRRQSLGEITLAGKTAKNIVAHPEPVFGADALDMLREYLVEGKTINDVFVLRGFLPISDNLQGKSAQMAASLVVDSGDEADRGRRRREGRNAPGLLGASHHQAVPNETKKVGA